MTGFGYLPETGNGRGGSVLEEFDDSRLQIKGGLSAWRRNLERIPSPGLNYGRR